LGGNDKLMKVPLKWLNDYVGLNLGYAQLVERLTLAGLEVANVHVLGLPVPEGLRIRPEDIGPIWDRKKIVIAQIRDVEKHPNADRLLLVTLDQGTGVPKQVITGAPNLKVGDRGQKVVLALAGSVLFDGHSSEKKLVELKPKELRGIMNDAMCCSALELGISEEHEGIIILQDDAPIGKSFQDWMGDIVLELDVLPNMARCLSIIGVAREVAALTDQRLNRRQIDVAVKATGEPIGDQVKVAIENPELSRRYLAALIKGVRIGPSPSWMQFRLAYAGMRPISNIVDITNYIMLEWGQPLHAFDFDLLKKRAGSQPPTIAVRPARAGETLVTIDKVKRELTAEHLVVADSVGPIALAGVMGGLDTEVSDTTTNVLLESANFNAISIRRTMKHFNLPSEASARFSRGIHPEIAKPAAEQAAELMRQFAGGKLCQGMVDCYPAPISQEGIILEVEEVSRLLGVNLPEKEVIQTLHALEFVVERDAPGTLLVRVPPHRLDVTTSADLIEELARIHGYDKLPATLLADRLPEQHTNRPLVEEERVRDILVAAGLQEVITYSLTEEKWEKPLGLPPGDYVRLLNPISPERSVMRRSLLAGVLQVTAENLRHASEVRLFEVGAIYLAKAGENLPEEPRRLALVLTGRRWPESWSDGVQKEPVLLDFFDIKGVIEALTGAMHLPEVTYQPTKAAYLHPARAAELFVQGKPVGPFGELHPKVAPAYDLGGRIVLAGELDLEAILAAVPERYKYTPVPRFPAALRDIAVIVAEAVPAEKIVAEMRLAGGELLRGVRLFDVYRGSSIPAGTKSLAYALSYQADDRTLTDKEVDKAHKKIEERLKHTLEAKVRGKDDK
jgi:phenylalanyl-tRNA synthetase beta chain